MVLLSSSEGALKKEDCVFVYLLALQLGEQMSVQQLRDWGVRGGFSDRVFQLQFPHLTIVAPEVQWNTQL